MVRIDSGYGNGFTCVAPRAMQGDRPYLEFIPWIRRPVYAWSPAERTAPTRRESGPPAPAPVIPPSSAAPRSPRLWPYRWPAEAHAEGVEVPSQSVEKQVDLLA